MIRVMIVVIVFVLAFAVIEQNRAPDLDQLTAECKGRGGVLVTNTRPALGEPSFVCVKPL